MKENKDKRGKAMIRNWAIKDGLKVLGLDQITHVFDTSRYPSATAFRASHRLARSKKSF
jgi:hypothetical protein